MTFVGQIRNISTQATNITYRLDDGTGTVEVKQWIDSDESTSIDDPTSAVATRPKLVENEWARVWGKLKAFNNKRHVGAHVIRPITDKMEITYHLLEATYVHLYFARGPLEEGSKAGAIEGAGSLGQNAGSGYGDGQATGGAGGRTMPNVSQTARRVYQTLKTGEQTNEGLHVQTIAASMGVNVNEVVKAGNELLEHSLIFTTVDDLTWALLEIS